MALNLPLSMTNHSLNSIAAHGHAWLAQEDAEPEYDAGLLIHYREAARHHGVDVRHGSFVHAIRLAVEDAGGTGRQIRAARRAEWWRTPFSSRRQPGCAIMM